MRVSIFLCALCLLCGTVERAESQGKKGYNIWSKEKVRYLRNKVDLDPYNPQVRVLLANALYADGMRFEARKQLQEALRLQGDFAEAHCNLGVILHSEGMLNEAQEHYEAALRLDSTMVEAMAGLGTLLCSIERQSEGLEFLERVVGQDPRRNSARYNMAVAYHKVGDFKRAIDHLEILLATDVAYPGARRSLALAYYSLGLRRLQAKQHALALEVLDQALAHEQREANMHFAKGLAHMEMREYTEAMAVFRETVRLESDHLPALHNLGAVYERLGRLEEAVRCYQQVKELAPHLSTIEAVKHASFDVDYLID